MAIYLNIHTAEETASVCISRDEEIIGEAVNEDQKDHAAWLHRAVLDLCKSNQLSMQDIAAVAVSIGPGSYTGLRVGLSAAKGFCYALNVPLITIGTLKLIAFAASKRHSDVDLICPVIDARRMEIYIAVYDKSLTEVKKPAAMIVDENSFVDLITTNKVLFCGTGSKKLQRIIFHPNAIFDFGIVSAASMAHFSHQAYLEKSFAELAYTEPLYIKEFYSPYRKPSI